MMNRNDSEFEKIPTRIFDDAAEAARVLASSIGQLIRARAADGKMVVLGLATGSTPVPLYRELIRKHQEEGLSFRNVITFNLDEYFPLSAQHPESYHRFMHQQLFAHIDIPADQVHIPCGDCPKEEVVPRCREYEEAIAAVGGLDIQILGIGRTGHIGFNEPGSSLQSRTRMVTLDSLTRSDAARDFLGEQHVPRHAITMGIGTILAARKIYLLAWGRAKAEILRKALEDAPVDSVPASYLQQHVDTEAWIDASAAGELTRCRSPWLTGSVAWDERLIRRAVADLSLRLGKPLLKLVDKDYQENGLAELVTENGPAYSLNIRIFNEVQHTITGWPGGKPGADDTYRPERAEPAHKRVVVLSPEPMDDLMAMGGTLNRMVAQGHEVTVAYVTSGSLAVPDEEALWASGLMLEAGSGGDHAPVTVAHQDLLSKSPYDGDTPAIRRLKGILRRHEARAALTSCGVDMQHARFLDLPFYESGKYRQFNITQADVEGMQELLDQKRPHLVFFTGSQADPSSVRAKSFQVLRLALEICLEDWLLHCNFWEFSSGNREWEVDQIDMAVPCSPDEMTTKIQAIYQHRTQMRQVPLAQTHQVEIWEQILERNRDNARRYDRLGLAEYEAMEVFRKWVRSRT